MTRWTGLSMFRPTTTKTHSCSPSEVLLVAVTVIPSFHMRVWIAKKTVSWTLLGLKPWRRDKKCRGSCTCSWLPPPRSGALWGWDHASWLSGSEKIAKRRGTVLEWRGAEAEIQVGVPRDGGHLHELEGWNNGSGVPGLSDNQIRSRLHQWEGTQKLWSIHYIFKQYLGLILLCLNATH